MHKIVKQRSGVLECVKNFEHHFSFFGRDFLCVSRVGHWLVLIVLQSDMPQLGIGHILDVNPLDLKLAFELILHPNTASCVAVVHSTQHFSHAAKVAGAINGEEQVDGALAVGGTFLGLEGRI